MNMPRRSGGEPEWTVRMAEKYSLWFCVAGLPGSYCLERGQPLLWKSTYSNPLASAYVKPVFPFIRMHTQHHLNSTLSASELFLSLLHVHTASRLRANLAPPQTRGLICHNIGEHCISMHPAPECYEGREHSLLSRTMFWWRGCVTVS